MCKKSTTVRKYKTVGFLSWTFSVPGLWSLHCSFMDLCAAKPLSSGPVSGPEHHSRSYRNCGVQHNASICNKATQLTQAVPLELNF